MILPQVKAKTARNVVRKALDFLWRSESEDPSAITVPTPAVMRSQCMNIHLQPTKDILLEGKFGSEFNIENAIDGCVALFKCVYVQWVDTNISWPVEGISPVSLCYIVSCNTAFIISMSKNGLKA